MKMSKKSKQLATKPKSKIKKNSEHLLDRDKNNTYMANDESIEIFFDSDGHEEFVHPNHDSVKNKKL